MNVFRSFLVLAITACALVPSAVQAQRPQPGQMDPNIGGGNPGQMETHWKVYTNDDARAVVYGNARWFIYEAQYNQNGSLYAVRYACITKLYSWSYDQNGNVNQVAVDYVVYGWSWPGKLP